MNDLREFFEIYDSNYEYSETIKAYSGSCFCASDNQLSKDVIWDRAKVQVFLEFLELYRPSINYYWSQQSRQENINYQSVIQYTSSLFQHHARLLIVRVDLHYTKPHRHSVSLEQAYDDFDKFRELISNKQTCFEHLKGYIWAIEQSKDTGYHYHIWLAYDGNKRHQDIKVGMQVGEKWLELTQGTGSYYNVNNFETKALYLRLGILGVGMIFRNNIQDTQNAIGYATYLASPQKQNQYVLVKIPNMRTFGTGQIPTK